MEGYTAQFDVPIEKTEEVVNQYGPGFLFARDFDLSPAERGLFFVAVVLLFVVSLISDESLVRSIVPLMYSLKRAL